MSKWRMVGAWIVVAALATTLTWQIVSAADAQVSDRPLAPLQVGAPITDSTSTSRPNATSSTIAGSSTTLVPGSSTSPTTTAGSSPSTTSDGSVSSTSATTSTSSAPWIARTIPTGGGVVVVSYRPGEVVLSSATPAPGFAAELKKEGPPEVDVEFESESAMFRVVAEWDDGQLAVEVEVDLDV